jgi:hypothetical protein
MGKNFFDRVLVIQQVLDKLMAVQFLEQLDM